MTSDPTQDDRLLDRLLESLRAQPPEERSRRLHRLHSTRPVLADRLARMLAHADVASRSESVSAWLRFGKFLRRNALASALVAVIVGALLASSAVFLYRLRQSELTRLAEAERAVRAEQFLAELFRTGSSYLKQDGRDPLAIFAELGTSLLRENASMDPRTRARIGLSLAQLQLARGDEAKARPLLDDAIDALGPDRRSAPLLAAELLDAIASSQGERGEHADAIQSQSEAFALLEQAGADAMQRALAQAHLADLLHRANRNDDARRQFDQAMPIVLASANPLTLDAIRALNHYVRFLREQSDLAALRELKPLLVRHTNNAQADTLTNAELTSIRGEIDSILDGAQAAAASYEHATERFESLLGANHPRVAQALTDACAANIEQGMWDVARTQCQRALSISYLANGPDSESVAVASSKLGIIAYNTGQLDEADAYLQRAQRLFENSEQPMMASLGRLELGRLAIARGRYEQALAHFRHAEAIRTAIAADNASLQIEIAQQQLFALIGWQRLDEAAGVLAEIDPVLTTLPLSDRQRHSVWLDVARAQLSGARKDTASTETAIAAALADDEAMPGQNDRERGWIRSNLALAAWQCGLPQRANALFDDALNRMLPESDGAHWAIAWAGARISGAPRNEMNDLKARRLLEDNGVDNEITRAYFALPNR